MRRPRSHQVTTLSAIGYGLGDFYAGGQGALVSTYLSLYWNKFCGLNISFSQTVLGLSAIVSAFVALGFGVLDDNFYRFAIGRRFGRRRLFLFATVPGIFIGTLLWIPGLSAWVYACAYVLWIALVQIFATAYGALPGEMTADFNERTQLSTARLFTATAASTGIPLLGGVVLSYAGEEKPDGYMWFALGMTAAFALAVFLCWKATWEMTPSQAGFAAFENPDYIPVHVGVAGWMHRGEKMLREYASTVKIAEFRKHLATYVLCMVSQDTFGQLFMFFVIYNWNKTAAFGSLLLSCTIVSLPLMPVFARIMVKQGPRKLYAVNYSASAIGLVWFALLWAAAGYSHTLVWTLFTVAGSLWMLSCKALTNYIPWAVFPYMSDIDQIVTTRYRSATFLGAQTFIRQSAGGLCSLLIGWVLAFCGFDATHHAQTKSAHWALGALFLGIYALCVVVGWLVSRTLVINRNTDNLVLQEIKRRQEGGVATDIDPQVRRTIEKMTGVAYEQCWQQ